MINNRPADRHAADVAATLATGNANWPNLGQPRCPSLASRPVNRGFFNSLLVRASRRYGDTYPGERDLAGRRVVALRNGSSSDPGFARSPPRLRTFYSNKMPHRVIRWGEV